MGRVVRCGVPQITSPCSRQGQASVSSDQSAERVIAASVSVLTVRALLSAWLNLNPALFQAAARYGKTLNKTSMMPNMKPKINGGTPGTVSILGGCTREAGYPAPVR